jgi:hypothetical protein
MTKPERQTLHDAAFPHSEEGRCPLEAAASVRVDTQGLHFAAFLDATIVATGTAVFALFPHARYFDAPVNRTSTVRSIAVFLTVLLVVVPSLLTIPKLLRERSESRRIAASGPSVNPWRSVDGDSRGRRCVYWRWTAHNILWIVGFRKDSGL